MDQWDPSLQCVEMQGSGRGDDVTGGDVCCWNRLRQRFSPK